MKSLSLAASAIALLAAGAANAKPDADEFAWDGGPLRDFTDMNGAGGSLLPGSGNGPLTGPAVGGASVVRSFEGINQYDTIGLRRGYVPPDTMGAVGTTQYVTMVNGAVAVYSKTGTRLTFGSDDLFWKAAGTTGFGSDPRVQYDKQYGRWIATVINNDLTKINVAVSATGDATGVWRGATFTGFFGNAGNGIADFPTLATDRNAVYIGTNNFTPEPLFHGTTLNVLNKSDVFNAAGPVVTSLRQFSTPYTVGAINVDGGFALQGVNSNSSSTTGRVVGARLSASGLATATISNAGTAGAIESPFLVLPDNYTSNSAGRQPNGGVGSRIVDTSDHGTSSSVVEVNGKIYATQTVTQVGTNATVIRITVLDAATNSVLSRTDIADPNYDFYYGSLSVNSVGQVVVGYNRSGYSTVDGKIRIYARTFNTVADGTLQFRNEFLIKESVTDHYQIGGTESQGPSGRQRFGDYSSVTLDPTNDRSFWVIGEYAREFNRFAAPGAGGSRYSTQIAEINVGNIPEPAEWAMMIAGFGFVGAVQRHRRVGYMTA